VDLHVLDFLLPCLFARGCYDIRDDSFRASTAMKYIRNKLKAVDRMHELIVVCIVIVQQKLSDCPVIFDSLFGLFS